MNGKQLACVILMMAIGLMTYTGQIVHKKVAAVRDEAKAARDAATASEDAARIVKITSERTEAETIDLRRFLETWTSYIEGMQTSQEVEEAVQASLRKSKLFVDSQKFEPKPGQRGKMISKTIKVALVAENDYPSTLNWLGELEKKLPLARITMCRLTPGKDVKSVHLELSLEVPLFNLKADPNEKSSSKKA